MKNTTLIFSLLFIFNFSNAQSKLIWTVFGQDRIETGNTDGTDLNVLLDFEGSSSGLAIHPVTNDIYFTNEPKEAILKLDYVTQNVDTIITGLQRPEQIAIDPVNGKIYWTDPGLDEIQRADLDGSNVDVIHEVPALNPKAVYYDTLNHELYFTRQSGIIGKINASTLNIDTIIMVTGLLEDMEVDMADGKIYWSNRGAADGTIQRCNLDGSSMEDVVTGLKAPYGIALDKPNGKIYWSDWGGSFPKHISSANLDGSGMEMVFEFSNYSPYALILVEDFVLNDEEIISKNNISVDVFPNPVADYLNIVFEKMDKDLTIELFDGQGKKLNSMQDFSPHIKIDFSNYIGGIYFLKIKNRNNFAVKKIIKK